ncbi:MAG: hypothetical protein K1X55_06065 [Chitinophagales bacterium]|nr:hypothetical protein [Chitinophagales bacterium]
MKTSLNLTEFFAAILTSWEWNWSCCLSFQVIEFTSFIILSGYEKVKLIYAIFTKGLWAVCSQSSVSSSATQPPYQH